MFDLSAKSIHKMLAESALGCRAALLTAYLHNDDARPNRFSSLQRLGELSLVRASALVIEKDALG
jgi:hypothetical protein